MPRLLRACRSALLAAFALAVVGCAASTTDSGLPSPAAGKAGAGSGWSCPGGVCEWGAPSSSPPTTARYPFDGSAGEVLTIDDGADLQPYLGLDLGGLDVEAADAGTVRSIGSGRTVVRVRNGAGLPVLGARVELLDAAGAVVGSSVSIADGRAPFTVAAPAGATVRAGKSLASGSAPAVDGAVTDVVLEAPAGPEVTEVDIVLVVDATASMADELDDLRRSLDAVTGAVAGGSASYGITAYRDEGEAFVTRSYGPTADPSAFEAALAEVTALGGGDTPEALGPALTDAVTRHPWRQDAIKLMFVLTDAPPHADDSLTYAAAAVTAAEQGVRIVPVGTQGLDPVAQIVLRQLAQASGGVVLGLVGAPGGPAPAGSSVGASSIGDAVGQVILADRAALAGG